MSTPQDPWQNPNPQWQQPQDGAPQPPPAYPGAYPAYGGPMGMPPATQRPSIPSTVRNAVTMMFIGMGLALLNIVIGFATMSSTKDKIRQTLVDKGTYTDALYNSTVGILTAGLIIGGLIGAGLWLWMALICKGGRNWGRIVSTVFFGIGCLSVLVGLTQDSSPLLKILSLLPTLVGLITIVLLWNKQSGPYFKPQMTYPYGYAPGQAPYGQQPPYGQPGQPPYGQG